MSILNLQSMKQNNAILWWSGQSASANSVKTITANGDVEQILPFAGAGIGMFDGTEDYLYSPELNAYNHSTNDFTYEFWINKSSSTRQTVICYGSSAAVTYGVYIEINTSSKVRFWVNVGGTQRATLSTTALTLNVWYHVACVRNGTNFYLFINGQLEGSFTGSGALSYGETFAIGKGGASTYYYLNGNLSEVRISDVARYTTNFTPPRHQLQSDANTKLLLHFNRNDTTFIDSSPSAHTITAYGDAKQLCSPCGSGVAYFDGTGDYLMAPISAVNYTSPWTIEGYLYCIAIPNNIALYSSGAPAGYGFVINVVSSTKQVVISLSSNGTSNSIGYLVSSTVISLNTWYHISVKWTGTTYALYINGNLESTISSSATITSTYQQVVIGSNYWSGVGSEILNGYISNFRISSIDRYTANFTPPTTPFKPDSYTKLLLHMDGVGNAFYDSSDPPGDNGFPILPDGVTVTPTGTFAVQKLKNGMNCLKFDGSTNYISLSDHDAWNVGANNFTVCGWFKFDNYSTTRSILQQYADTSNIGWYMGMHTTNGLDFGWKQSGTWVVDIYIGSDISNYTAATWYFISVTRTGSTFEMRINNIFKKSVTYAGTLSDISASLRIGYDSGGSSYYALGNIKDLMIFKKALTQDQIGAIMAETFIY